MTAARDEDLGMVVMISFFRVQVKLITMLTIWLIEYLIGMEDIKAQLYQPPPSPQHNASSSFAFCIKKRFHPLVLAAQLVVL